MVHKLSRQGCITTEKNDGADAFGGWERLATAGDCAEERPKPRHDAAMKPVDFLPSGEREPPSATPTSICPQCS